MGAATADAVYGSLAAFGLTAISTFLIDQSTPLSLVGGAFLLYLGVRTLFSTAEDIEEKPSQDEAKQPQKPNLLGDYVSTFALTITNPLTILAFLAIFAGLGTDAVEGNPVAAIVMVSGVFLGSALWWLTLCGGVSLLRSRITSVWMQRINWLSGGIIILFAIRILWDVIV